jgi:hypothetical protein
MVHWSRLGSQGPLLADDQNRGPAGNHRRPWLGTGAPALASGRGESPGHLVDVFHVSKLDSVFPFYATVEEAAKA